MSLPPQPRRRFFLSLGGVALLTLHGHAGAQHRPIHPPATPWQQALDARQVFEAQPEKSKAAFVPVLDAFRAIYHDNPRDTHAAEAVNAVAQLLAEQGQALGDARLLHSAVAQYEFLRKQYPGTGLRWQALLAEARIEDTGLHDAKAAQQKYAELIHDAPHSVAAGEARAELAEATRAAEASANDLPAQPAQITAHSTQARLLSPAEEIRAARVAPEKYAASADPDRARTPMQVAAKPAAEPAFRAHEHTPLASVNGIRHWSTPTYTRVAIDLGGEVTFQAARVPHPDRIYFDLHGARLSPELIGKSFAVTDDGFLKRIRAAQDSSSVTRVVLDVSQVADYSAFLLPNPYRLIIDIHGAKAAIPAPAGQNASSEPDTSAEAPVPANAVQRSSAAADSSGLPAMSPTAASASLKHGDGAASTANASSTGVPAPRTGVVAKATAARPVPNTVESRSPAAAAEVAEVSDAPGREEATSRPTSKPIASAPAAAARTRHPHAKPVPENEDAGLPARAAARTAEGATSLTRALGLGIGRIVIDAGHGGHDSGTLGVDGIEEKDVVLDVALRLGKLLHDRLGAEIIYTRSDDTFIPLETRTAIANKAQADLFLSIHANSSADPSARGVETYYLNFTSDPSALDVAARENAVSGESIHQLSTLVKKIALKDKIDESREFASDVESSLYFGLQNGNAGLKNRGVKKAPFIVLIGANMPSILAEISFVTNPRDARELREPEYRERVAESLFRGVQQYAHGLAGAHPAGASEVRAAVE